MSVAKPKARSKASRQKSILRFSTRSFALRIQLRYTPENGVTNKLVTLPARVKLAIFWKLDWQINWLTFPQELILAFWIIKNFHKDENKRFSKFEHMNSIYLNRDAPNLANKRPR